MRRRTQYHLDAFTRIEILVISLALVVVFLLASAGQSPRVRVPRITCVNYLKQIGTANRIWADDHGGAFPTETSASRGGWSDSLTNANCGVLCWTNYSLVANELGQSPKVLICPSDKRKAAQNLTTGEDFKGLKYIRDFTNTNLSYFVGTTARYGDPRSILAGDRNLEQGNAPGQNYGFSPDNGLGNDVTLQSSSNAPICWSKKMHSKAGNVVMGDESVQMVSSDGLRALFSRATPTTNWPAGHVPSVPSVRVLFP